MLSNAVSEKEQGKVMGSAGAGFGLAWFINDILMGVLSSASIKLPIMTGGAFLYITIILMLVYGYKTSQAFGRVK